MTGYNEDVDMILSYEEEPKRIFVERKFQREAQAVLYHRTISNRLSWGGHSVNAEMGVESVAAGSGFSKGKAGPGRPPMKSRQN